MVAEGIRGDSGEEQGITRVSKGREGYKKLVVWKNAWELRRLIYQITDRFPKKELRRVSQMQDAARSVKQNIQEGYMRASLGEYVHFLKITQGSLAELSGDIEDCMEDGLITKEEFEGLDGLVSRTSYLLKRLIQSLERKRIASTNSSPSDPCSPLLTPANPSSRGTDA
jgi:four helix bundle protein